MIKTALRFASPPVPRQSTHRIVVHHTATASTQKIEDIHNYHRSKGWKGIGYNIVQQNDAKWYEGRGLGMEGAHARGYNRNAIGISLTGDFEARSLPSSRWKSLVEMCIWLCRRYGLDYTDVVGHNELPGAATLCPGQHIDMSSLRQSVRQGLEVAEPSPVYRIIVDGDQVGAYRHPIEAVTKILGETPDSILIEKT